MYRQAEPWGGVAERGAVHLPGLRQAGQGARTGAHRHTGKAAAAGSDTALVMTNT